MKSNTNKQRLTNLLKGMQRSIDLFQGQGYTDVFFTAQFLRSGKKQNGIERGDVSAFATQVRAYVVSEDADSVRIEFFDENTGKSIYSKVLTDLRTSDGSNAQQAERNQGLSGTGEFGGFGMVEVKQLVAKQLSDARKDDEFQRVNKELEDLRSRNASLEHDKEELEATLKAKRDTEYYMGIIGAAFPGLAPLFSGTPLAQAANFLAGTPESNNNALSAGKEAPDPETQSIGAMISEFCNTLTPQEASAVHLLFMAFEKDKAQIQRALQHITLQTTTTV